jgi:hypothetical protein
LLDVIVVDTVDLRSFIGRPDRGVAKTEYFGQLRP